MEAQKTKVEEVVESMQNEEVQNASESDSGSDDGELEHGQTTNSVDTPGAGSSSQSQSSKKKRKKKLKAKLLNALKPGQNEIPQTLIDQVMDRVRESGEAPEANEDHVRKALEQLKIMDVIKGKAGMAGRGKKDMGNHKVCALRKPGMSRFVLTMAMFIVLVDSTCHSARRAPTNILLNSSPEYIL